MPKNEQILLRDLAIFQLKLVLDGLKDIVLAPVSIVAAGLDLVFPGRKQGHRFYAVMKLGERFDRWLSLFSAANRAAGAQDGLFGPERADPGSMLGRIESMLFDELERPGRADRAA